MTNYEVTGVDVSHWQGVIDWSVMAERAHFAFIKAGQGNGFVDSAYTKNVDGAFVNGVPFGLYWFVKPDKDWRKHAEAFANLYEDTPGELPPVMDIETSGGLDKFALNNWLAKFVADFEERAGVELMVYTSAGFFNSNLPMTNWAKHRKLWIASWWPAWYGGEPSMPLEWVDINHPKPWTFWQWSNKGDGAKFGAQSKQIDLNRYYGTAAEFLAEFGVNVSPVEPPAPPPEPEPEVDEIRIIGLDGDETLNMRSAPWGEIVAKTWNGREFDVVDSDYDAKGRLWYALAPRIWVASWYTKPIKDNGVTLTVQS